MEDGATAEIAVVGREGAIGVSLFMGGETTPGRAVVQSAGHAYRLTGKRLKLDDGVSFVHVASTEPGNNPLADVAAFQAFQADIGERCDEPPVVTELHEVGSFRF